MIIDTYFDIILIVKLIQETDIFKIQSNHGSIESSEFINLFDKGSTIMNAKVSFKNHKKHMRENWDQSKKRSNMFEKDKNSANIKKNDKIIPAYDDNSNSI